MAEIRTAPRIGKESLVMIVQYRVIPTNIKCRFSFLVGFRTTYIARSLTDQTIKLLSRSVLTLF